jgi:hypothetical protein
VCKLLTGRMQMSFGSFFLDWFGSARAGRVFLADQPDFVRGGLTRAIPLWDLR